MINWHDEFQKNYEKWDNCGRRAIEENCNHKTQSSSDTNMRYSGYCDECGHGEDSGEPMMNFGYPLEREPDDEKILKVVNETNCTVMHNTDTDEYFLALTGGGMDLSQDIALAYHILEKWIPFELAIRVCTQKELSVGGKNWDILKQAMINSLDNEMENAMRKLEIWKEGDKK
jgi:hypothetical protein